MSCSPEFVSDYCCLLIAIDITKCPDIFGVIYEIYTSSVNTLFVENFVGIKTRFRCRQEFVLK